MPSIKTHLKNYGEQTSVKGVSKAIRSEHYGLKIIWLLACLGGASLAIFQLIILLSSYFEYATITQISQCSDCSPEFPDVTVCNLNPLSLVSTFPELLPFEEYLEIVNDIGDISDDKLEEISKYTNSNRETFDNLLYEAYYSLAGYFQNLNESYLLKEAAKRNGNGGLVAFCQWYDWEDRTYTEEDCFRQSLYFFTTPDYSVCTTIHMNDTNASSNNTDVKGFEAILFINDFSTSFMIGYEHNILKSQGRGARVLIHPPNSLPEMRKGFNIAPGHEISIHIEAREVKRLPAPYSDCSNQEYLETEADASTELAQIKRFIYNDQDSVSLCQQEELVKKCGCFHPSLPMTRFLKSKYSVPGCFTILYENSSQYLLNESAEVAYLNLEQSTHNVHCYSTNTDEDEVIESCSFRKPCNEKKYRHKLYQSPWPHESYQLAFYCRHINNQHKICEHYGSYSADPGLEQLFHKYTDILNDTGDDEESIFARLQTEDMIARNFIQLKVYFLERNIEFYTQVAAVTAVYLIGSVGGVLNLWIGVTLFTLIELVDFFYTFVVDLWQRRQKKKEKESQVHPLDSNF